MANSTTQANIRSGPKGDNATVGHAGSVVLSAQFTVDPTAASGPVGFSLPPNSLVIGAAVDGGATGGVSPTIDIGDPIDPDAFLNEVPADTPGFTSAAGAFAGSFQTSYTPIYAGVGASAATGGTVQVTLLYVRKDEELGVNA